jgi:SAM-dependent methyltransferase
MNGTTETTGRRTTMAAFDHAYDDVILGNHFFEDPGYYRRYRRRYRRTLEHIARLPLAHPARILEVGGGQIALLCHEMFQDECALADVSDRYADAVTRFGLEFVTCDLLHDDLDAREPYDLIVLCEVVEHLPIPPHIVLEKLRARIRPGGYLLVTTPNLYRLRNVVRLAMGLPVLSHFFYPDRGSSIGHLLEYSADHLRWQIERAGFVVESICFRQLSNAGSTLATRIGRLLLAPLLLRPLWRDSLVACARNAAGNGQATS